MEWYDLRVNVVKKESKEASAFTPVVGTTVYFNLSDKGYYNITSGSAVTNAKGTAILLRDYLSGQTSINNLNTAEYWDAYIYYKDKGIPTAVMPISENNTTITIIEKAENTWNELAVYVGRNNGSEVVPVIDNTVNFYLNRKNSARPTILSGVTNKLGYAFVQNNGTYNDAEYWSASTVYSSTTYSSQTYNLPTEKGEIIFSGGAKQSVHKLTVYTTYNKNPITAYVACFLFVNDSASYLRLTGNTEIADGVARIDFNIDGVSYEYQNFDYVKLNAYNDEFKVAYIGSTQMIPELDTETGGYFLNVELTSQSAYYGKIAKKVHSCDLLYKYITNGGKLGVYPWTFVAKKGSGGNVIYCSESTSAYTSNSSNPTTFTSDTPYMKFYSHPTDTTYSSAYTDVNMINYVYENNAHQIGNVYIFCPKITTLKIENPVVLDTVPYDLDSPVYNLPDVTITYNYIRGGAIAYTTTASSNDLYTVFDLGSMPGGAAEFLKTIAGGNSNRIERVLSKHHYIDNITYAFISGTTYPVHHAFSAAPYNGHFLYFCKYIMNGGQPTLFSLPQRYVYIEREQDVCYTSDMFNDYVQGFDYNYSGDVLTAITASTNEYYERDRGLVLGSGSGYPCVSAFTILPSNKLIVATHGFYNSCATKVSPQISPIPSAVAEYKSSFVDRAITRTEYYTIYANKPTDTMVYNDVYFDPNDANFSGHAYNEHMQSFWPHEGKWWNYLEFFPTGNTSGTVKLQAVAIPNEDIIKTLEYSYWGDRWTHYDIEQVIELYPGTNVRFRNSENVTTFSPGVDNGIDRYYVFIVTGEKMCVKGNLSSLINVSGMGLTVTGDYSFMKLFYDSKIYDAENLRVDPTTVPDGCYYKMFEGCTNLVKGPKLINASVGGEACMGHMFEYCINMESGPLRIKLREYERLCCDHMFTDCHSLQFPPLFTYNTERNTFGEACFGQMFLDCVSLKQPTLNPDQVYFIEYINEHPERAGYGCAWQLGDTVGGLVVGVNSCYEMFKGCSSLEETPIFRPSIVNSHGCFSTFSACTSLTSVKFSMPFENSTVEQNGCAYMFDNCWSISTLKNVSLSATNLSERCYFHMFDTCYDLHSNLPYIKATTIPNSGCAYMYRDCYNNRNGYLGYINQFITEDFDTVGNFGMAHMFERCQNMDFHIGRRDLYYKPTNTLIIMDAAEILNHGKILYQKKTGDTDKRYYVYVYDHTNDDDEPVATCIGTVDMYSPYFDNDNTLNSSYEYRHTFNYLYLNATHLNDSCYSHMFSACTGLHYAHHFVLNAKTLANKCYEFMFCSCSNLFSVPLCFSGITSYASSACQYMFAFDGNFKPNNNIMNQTPQTHWYKYESNFNYICPSSGETAYSTQYYLYNNGLRSVQKAYNYRFYTHGDWLRNNESSDKYAYVDNEGLNYDSLASESYNLINVNVLKTVSLNSSAYTNAYNCFSHMFYGCKGLKETHWVINNSYIRDSMFESMFNCCYSMTKAPTFNVRTTGTSIVYENGCLKMFKDCHEMLNVGCNNGALRSTEIKKNAYYMMYMGCYKIITGPRIYATNLGFGAMGHMFGYCYRLTGITNNLLPSTTLNEQCYYGMFAHCFSLINAPTLPATSLSADCYSYMFNKDCLYYYTGYTRYWLHATCHNPEQRSCPTTANGRCTLSEFVIYDDTGHNTLDTTWKMELDYFGNYFYNFSKCDYAELNTPGIWIVLPEPYAVNASPYGNLTEDVRYFREDTDLDSGREPHTSTVQELLDAINRYFPINSRNILTKIHKYTWEKGYGSRNFLKVLKDLISDGINPYYFDSEGFPNDVVNFDYYKNRTKTKNVPNTTGGTFEYDFPYFLDETAIDTLNSNLQTLCGATSNYVSNQYKLYQVYIRYRVDLNPYDEETSDGYSLNYATDDNYKVNKEIRDETWYTWHYEYENGRFFIPVNDRSEVWNQSLSSVTMSATYLNENVAKGMFSFLNLKSGAKLHAPGSASNYRPILPNNWSVVS